MAQTSLLHRQIDRIAAAATGLCALHCAAVPLLFALLPSLRLALFRFGSPEHQLAQWLLSSQRFEAAIVCLAIAVAALSLSWGYMRHRALQPALWASAGASLLLLGTFGPPAQLPLAHASLVAIGGLLLAIAHLRNAVAGRCGLRTATGAVPCLAVERVPA